MTYKPKTVAEWFLHRAAADDKTLTQMKLQKLVYMAHGWKLGLFGQPLINEFVEAWQWGPVIRDLYADYVQYGASPIDVASAPPRLDEQSGKLLEKVWDTYGRYTAAQLSDLTHRKGTPWSLTYQPKNKLVIPNALIKSHYEQLAAK